MGQVADYNSVEPLLKERDNDDEFTCEIKKIPIWNSSLKLSLKVVMWVIFILWATFIFLYPSDFVNDFSNKFRHATTGTVFGITGSIFLLFSAPVLIIAFLAIPYLILSGEDDEVKVKKAKKGASFRLWTFPVLVDGPFGVVTAAEMIGIVLFSAFTIWAIVMYTIKNYRILELFHVPSKEKCVFMLELTGLRFGFIGLICLAFLFLPVARGSILLRLIDIPFEHATRYHVWLGHLTMALFTLHGLFYVIGWAMQGRLVEELLAWKHIGIANFPGVISLTAGILMWVTSMPGMRRINFELFFYTHQLYVVFVVFFALHVGDFVFTMAAAGIFLFMLDRFLRFCQSRRTVDVLSAKCFPCGTVELVLSKPENLRYNALGWVFLQVRELSWLQWHPFSVSSSPLDGKNHLAILIKVLGGWTKKLKDQILNLSEGKDESETLLKHHRKINVSVEGPYGHELAYHLTYENMILVAGGIGISPFLAILSDILHRINDGKPLLPKNILVVWAIKKTDEFPLLQTVDMEGICPNFSDKLNLEIITFVTRETEPPLEEGIVSKPVNSCVFPGPTGRKMSVLVGTGDVMWSGLYLVASTVGLAICVALLNILYVNPFNVTYWWYKGLLFIGCMTASTVVFGGSVICLWHLWERNTSRKEDFEAAENIGVKQQSEPRMDEKSGQECYFSAIRYGQRPDFGEIFGTMSERWGNVDIGVVVCGPPALQTSVAKECRTQNFKRRSNESIFHFNSHSFDL